MVLNNTLKWEATEDKILLYHAPLWEEILLIKAMPSQRGETGRSCNIFLWPGPPSCSETLTKSSLVLCIRLVWTSLRNAEIWKCGEQNLKTLPLTCSVLYPQIVRQIAFRSLNKNAFVFNEFSFFEGTLYDYRQVICLQLSLAPFLTECKLEFLCVCAKCHAMYLCWRGGVNIFFM